VRGRGEVGKIECETASDEVGIRIGTRNRFQPPKWLYQKSTRLQGKRWKQRGRGWRIL